MYAQTYINKINLYVLYLYIHMCIQLDIYTYYFFAINKCLYIAMEVKVYTFGKTIAYRAWHKFMHATPVQTLNIHMLDWIYNMVIRSYPK